MGLHYLNLPNPLVPQSIDGTWVAEVQNGGEVEVTLLDIAGPDSALTITVRSTEITRLGAVEGIEYCRVFSFPVGIRSQATLSGNSLTWNDARYDGSTITEQQTNPSNGMVGEVVYRRDSIDRYNAVIKQLEAGCHIM